MRHRKVPRLRIASLVAFAVTGLAASLATPAQAMAAPTAIASAAPLFCGVAAGQPTGGLVGSGPLYPPPNPIQAEARVACSHPVSSGTLWVDLLRNGVVVARQATSLANLSAASVSVSAPCDVPGGLYEAVASASVPGASSNPAVATSPAAAIYCTPPPCTNPLDCGRSLSSPDISQGRPRPQYMRAG